MASSALSIAPAYSFKKSLFRLLKVCNSIQATSLRLVNCVLTASIVAFNFDGEWAKSLYTLVEASAEITSKRFAAPVNEEMAVLNAASSISSCAHTNLAAFRFIKLWSPKTFKAVFSGSR
ncbi:hypothetical protein D3C85_1394000 [compost metagenome]